MVGGTVNWAGNVFALNPTTGIYGPVCDDAWDLADVSYLKTFKCNEYLISDPKLTKSRFVFRLGWLLITSRIKQMSTAMGTQSFKKRKQLGFKETCRKFYHTSQFLCQ